MSDKKKILLSLVLLIILPIVYGQDFSFIAETAPGSLCQGSIGLFTDIIENAGNSDLEFTFTNLGEASSFSVTVPNGLILSPGSKKVVYTYVSPRSTTRIGDYGLEVKVTSSGKTETLKHVVTIKDCYGFEISALELEKSVCPCETQKYDFVLKNLGDYSETYLLIIEGQAKDWITLSENEVTLNAKDSKTIFAYVTADCNALGNYEFTVVAKPKSNSRTSSGKATVNVQPCYSYDVTTEKDFVSLCEHSSERIPIQIENKGTTSNLYNLEIQGPEWAFLENNKVNINSGESATVNLVLSPSYGIEGDFDINFKAVSDKGKIEQSNLFKTSVKKCHSVLLNVLKDTDRTCNSLTTNYEVNIKNTGEFDKEFRLETSGADWVRFDKDSIKINKGEEANVNLVVSPKFDTTAGDYTINARAIALDESQASSEDRLVISTTTREECYKPQIGIKDKKVVVSYDSSAVIPVIIENKGTYKATYNIDVTGTASNFLKLNPGVVNIESGKAEITYLYIAPSGEVKNGDYVASISVRLGDSTILASDNIDITVSESKVAEEVIPEELEVERVSVWQRIKNWFKNLFSAGPTNITKEPEFNVTGEFPIVGENITETEVIEEIEEIPEENVTVKVPEVKENKLFTEGDVETVNADQNDEFTFVLGEEEHKVTISDITGDEVQIVIESDPVYASLKYNETKKIDVDGDGFYDLEITLDRVDPNTGQATLTYKKISEKIQETTEEVMEENVTGELGEEQVSTVEGNVSVGVTEVQPGFFSLYKWYIIIGIIIAILLIVFISTKSYKKVIEFFEEEVEEPNNKKKKKPKKKEVVEEEEEWT